VVFASVVFRYFEGGVSSVYLWDLDHGFAGVILIKKAGDGSRKIKGCWDSIHVIEVQVSHKKIFWKFSQIDTLEVQTNRYFGSTHK